MFVTILYIVFQCFSSMISILHIQIMYIVHKPLTIISMIFIYFTRFFWALEAAKPTKSVLLKTDLVNQLVYRFFCPIYRFSSKNLPIWILCWFLTGLSVFGETNKTGPVWFSGLCRFLNPYPQCVLTDLCLVALILVHTQLGMHKNRQNQSDPVRSGFWGLSIFESLLLGVCSLISTCCFNFSAYSTWHAFPLLPFNFRSH
jgi:hypothetical protein